MSIAERPAIDDQLLAALRQVSLFSGLDDEAEECLAALRQGLELHFAPAERIVSDGDPAALYIVLEGEFQVKRQVEGRAVFFPDLDARRVFGELPLLLGVPFFASFDAVTPCHVIRLEEDSFWHMLSRCRSVTREVMQAMARRLKSIEVLGQQQGQLSSLGSMAAGLAHELNNPAAAARRAAEELRSAVHQAQDAACLLGKRGLPASSRESIVALRTGLVDRAEHPASLQPLEQSDLEEQLGEWLEGHGIEEAWDCAPLLVRAGFDHDGLEALARQLPDAHLPAVLRWAESSLHALFLLSDLEKSTTRVSDVVRAVSSYSFMDQAPQQEVDLHTGLDDTVTIMAYRLRGVKVVREYDRSIPRLYAYGGELNQVWTNLIDNAVDALEEAGKGLGSEIRIRTALESGRVLVEIRDNGPGIPEKTREKLFQPFFTTKGVGKGTGIGLVTSRRIVVGRHGGDMKVESRPGDTRFQVYLPLEPLAVGTQGRGDPETASLSGAGAETQGSAAVHDGRTPDRADRTDQSDQSDAARDSIPNTEHRTPNTEHRTPNTEHRTPEPKRPNARTPERPNARTPECLNAERPLTPNAQRPTPALGYAPGPNALLTALRAVPLLAPMLDEGDPIRRILEEGQELRLAPGEELGREGEAPFFSVILDGEVRIFKRIDGQDVFVGTQGAGAFLGEVPILLGLPFVGSVCAARPTWIYRFEAETFWRIVGMCPRSARLILRTLAERLQLLVSLALQQEKLSALGTLAAGLAHELNNPSAAALRAASHLRAAVVAQQAHICQLGVVELTSEQRETLQRLYSEVSQPRPPQAALDPLARSDREAALAERLRSLGLTDAWMLAPALAASGLCAGWLDDLRTKLPAAALPDVIRWVERTVTVEGLLDEVETSTRRIAMLVKAVKSYSHAGGGDQVEVDLHAVLDDALAVLSHKLEGMRVLRDYAPDLPSVPGYAGELAQVWVNLLDNAAAATGERGEVRLHTTRENGQVLVEIADDGPGIPPALERRIWEPFFTTRPVGEGMGLGLVTAHRIVVDHHHGDITVRSAPGNTRFQVRLPLRTGT